MCSGECVCVRALTALPFSFQPALSQCFPLIRSYLRLPFLLFVSSLKMNLRIFARRIFLLSAASYKRWKRSILTIDKSLLHFGVVPGK